MADRNTEVDDPKRLRSEVEAAMFHHSRIKPRGFDSIKARAQIHAEIDDLLDRRSISLALAAIEEAS